MKREYTAVYQTVEDGWIMATVPELPGAVTQGRDIPGVGHRTSGPPWSWTRSPTVTVRIL